MTYTLYKITERHIRGCPEDESESSTYKIYFHLIEDGSKEEEEFHEHMADECGYQDYSFQIDYKRMVVFDSLEEAREVSKKIEIDSEKISINQMKKVDELITSFETDQDGNVVEVMWQ